MGRPADSLRGCAAPSRPSAATRRPSGVAPAPPATVRATRGTRRRSRGGNPSGSCESTSRHVLRRPVGRVPRRRNALRAKRGKEVRVGQTRVSRKDRAPLRTKRFGRERGGLVIAVGFAEQREANTGAVESVGRGEQTRLARHGTQHEMGVRGVSGEVAASGFDGRVGRLNRDLRRGEVAPDQDVQVRNLGERRGHESAPRGDS